MLMLWQETERLEDDAALENSQQAAERNLPENNLLKQVLATAYHFLEPQLSSQDETNLCRGALASSCPAEIRRIVPGSRSNGGSS
jgi:hypothetical protein